MGRRGRLVCNLTEVGEPDPAVVATGMKRWAELLLPHALEQVRAAAREQDRQAQTGETA